MQLYLENSKNRQRARKGYTLIELSVVMVLVMLIASTLVAMLTQQTQFFRWWKTQDFIAEDAPLTNAMVVRLFAQADAFRIHRNRSSAMDGTNGVTAGGRAMLLGFTEGDGTKRKGVIWYARATGALWYGVVNEDDTMPNRNRWIIASGISDATFSVVNGTMQITLTGPYGGQLTYAATPSL